MLTGRCRKYVLVGAVLSIESRGAITGARAIDAKAVRERAVEWTSYLPSAQKFRIRTRMHVLQSMMMKNSWPLSIIQNKVNIKYEAFITAYQDKHILQRSRIRVRWNEHD